MNPTAPSSTAAHAGLQIARFDELKPKSRAYADSHDVPAEAYELLAAKTIYLVMAPEGAKGSNANPAIRGAPGLTVNVCRCPPGNGPMMHRHVHTVENFMCLAGEFELVWGAEGEHKTRLKPFDTVSVPPNEYRAFRNVGDEEALLLVMIQGGNEQLGDVTYSKQVGELVVQQFGAGAKQRLEQGLGWHFA